MMTTEKSVGDVLTMPPATTTSTMALTSDDRPSIGAPPPGGGSNSGNGSGSSSASSSNSVASLVTRVDAEKENVRDPRSVLKEIKSMKAEEDADEEEEEEEDEDEEEDKTNGNSKKDADAKDGATSDDNKTASSGSTGDANGTNDDKKTKKSRRELPAHTVAILKQWMLSQEHIKHPYPTDEDKQMLLKKTGISMKQLTNWFTNARKRIWKPMMKKQHSLQMQSALEYDKLRAREAYGGMPMGMQHPHAAAPYASGPRAISHSFDGGSIGMPRDRAHTEQYGAWMDCREHMGAPGPMYQQHPQGHPSQLVHPARGLRSMSESTHAMDEYAMARKRAYEPAAAASAAYEDDRYDKRYRLEGGPSSPALSILQEWLHVRANTEYPFPNEVEMAQLSRETGLDVRQIENWFKDAYQRASQQQQSYPPARSIPSRENPLFPPPPVPADQRSARSIPGAGNPLFPARGSAHHSSGPSQSRPLFPPPPASRPGMDHAYGARVKSMSAGPGPATASALPSLSTRSILNPAAGSSPSFGQPREARSHTLDMGALADARRRKMNFQDILDAQKHLPSAAAGPPPTSGPAAPTSSSARPRMILNDNSVSGYAESSPSPHHQQQQQQPGMVPPQPDSLRRIL